jgi:hypothetical protein
LSPKQDISDAVELYQGKVNSWDILGLQKYERETGYLQDQIEPDRPLTEKPLDDFDEWNLELIE